MINKFNFGENNHMWLTILYVYGEMGGGDGYEKAKGQTRFFQSDCSVCGSIFTLDRAVNFLKFW